ncbi:MAG: F0F1 ATP synthase subunit A [Lentimicrobiaceae bacterium]|nr:F0F1 ATP synthase subunit A [Lentimicrobiaceae bacterium]
MSRIILSLLLLVLSPLPLAANDMTEPETFNAEEYFMEHVLDSYSWHITTVKNKDITIPLPIILFDDWKLVYFMSSKLKHGNEAYKGYALGFTKDSEGKIVKLQGDYANFTGVLEQNEKYEWTPVFFNISFTKNVCAIFISIIILCLIFLSVAKTYKQNPNKAPKGLQGMMEIVVLFIRDEIAIPLIGKEKYHKYFPYLLTLFFFILINNLLGLFPVFPGGANVTGNIAITLVLALITFFIVSFSAKKKYWIHIINPPDAPWWLKFPIPLLPFLEVVGVFTKPFTLMIRLFANMLAGHIIILGFLGLIFIFGAINPIAGYLTSPVSIFFYVFMGAIELLVIFIQAYIFTLLTAFYIGMARE